MGDRYICGGCGRPTADPACCPVEPPHVQSVRAALASGATWVCFDCDIAGCRHYREALAIIRAREEDRHG